MKYFTLFDSFPLQHLIPTHCNVSGTKSTQLKSKNLLRRFESFSPANTGSSIASKNGMVALALAKLLKSDLASQTSISYLRWPRLSMSPYMSFSTMKWKIFFLTIILSK